MPPDPRLIHLAREAIEQHRRTTQGPWIDSDKRDEGHDPSQVRCAYSFSKDRVLLEFNPHFPFAHDHTWLCAAHDREPQLARYVLEQAEEIERLRTRHVDPSLIRRIIEDLCDDGHICLCCGAPLSVCRSAPMQATDDPCDVRILIEQLALSSESLEFNPMETK